MRTNQGLALPGVPRVVWMLTPVTQPQHPGLFRECVSLRDPEGLHPMLFFPPCFSLSPSRGLARVPTNAMVLDYH